MSRTISARSMTFHKRVFPVVWFGFLIIFVGGVVFRETPRGLDATDSLNPFAKNEVAEDLIVRVDQARARRPI